MSNYFMKIGELAKLTKVTVRTLHHYHQIGLLIPSHLTDSGHRLYGENDLKKLYRILALKDFGFSLDEIHDIISIVDASPAAIVNLQLQKTEYKLNELQKLHQELTKLKDKLQEASSESMDDFIEIIQLMQMNSNKYLSEEQIEMMKKQFSSVTEEEMANMEKEWYHFISTLRECYKTKKASDSDDMKYCIEYWKNMNNKLLAENDDLKKAVYQYHAGQEDSPYNYGLTPELYLYLKEAIKDNLGR